MTHPFANFGRGASTKNLSIQQSGKGFISFLSFLKNILVILLTFSQKLHLFVEFKNSLIELIKKNSSRNNKIVTKMNLGSSPKLVES